MTDPLTPPRAVVHVPHAATAIPPDVREQIALSDADLENELLLMTDWFTDELFATPAEIATTVAFGFSRLVVDPERFTNDALEPMATRGMGVVYTCTDEGRPLRDNISEAERASLISRFYEPHHDKLNRATRSVLNTHGRCLIVDGHSFRSHSLPCDLDQTMPRPDICIGADDQHTPELLVSAAVDAFRVAGLSVAVNRPYAGTMVPSLYLGNDRVRSVMIEVNRRLYMVEETGAKTSEFDAVCGLVQSVIGKLVTLELN